MFLYFFLGLFVSSTILLIIFLVWFTKKDKVDSISKNYSELKQKDPDVAIEESDFYR